MIKKISNFSVRYPVTVFMIILATMLLGYISFDKLGIDLFPNLNNPRLYVELSSGERPPEEMEEKFVERVEALAIRQTGVVNVSSQSRVGTARVEVEYSWEMDMDEAFLDLSKALVVLNQDEELEEMNITQYDPNAEPVMLVAFQHKQITDLNELRKVAENYIRNDLIRLEGIAEVEVDGVEQQEVVIETNEYLLNAYDISLSEISAKIQSFNQNISGGSVVEMGRRYVVKGLSEIEDLYDLENIIIKMGGAAANLRTETDQFPILLKDVAKVSFNIKDVDNRVFLDGEPCLGLAIYKETRYNTVRAVEDLQTELKEMERALPNYKFTIIQDQGNFISSAIDEVKDSALGGIVLAVFVLLLFLRRIGPTVIVSIAIPISIVATFTLMYFNDLTLNIMTLGGLALGAGMLVDNAIVVLENIFRNHEAGMSTKDAAINGTSEVGGAIVASTLTTIVVFLPIVYLHGASGELFKEQALTVTYSLLSSLVVAVLMIPMFYNLMYRKKSPFKGTVKSSVKVTGYGRFLKRMLNHKWLVVSLATLMLLGGYVMMKDLGSEFMPKTESNEFFVDIRMAEGTRLERTNGAVTTIEETLKEMGGDAIEMVYSQVGPTSGLSQGDQSLFDDQNAATIKVFLKAKSGVKATSFMAQVERFFPSDDEMEISTRQQETALQNILGSNTQPVVVEVSGDDQQQLEELSLKVIQVLSGIQGINNIASSVEGGAPEVEVLIDRYRAGLMGVNVADIVNAIKQKLDGTNAGQMEVEGELNDITIKLNEIGLRELENLMLKVGNLEVPLRDVAQIKTGSSPKEILHKNQSRIVSITASKTNDIPLDQLSETIREAMADVPFPPEYRYTISGEEAQRAESMANLTFALVLSLILVYMVLASQFESLVHPFTILLTVPLAVVGAVLVFYVQGAPLNIMAYIGIIMLVGIAVNDSIILVDAINQLRKEGMTLLDSIVNAGQRRIRPIIMTTLTTILALVPLTIGFGESASLRSPMAWAVIGGLITSTLLTLVVIPCVYLLIENFLSLFRKGSKEVAQA